MKRSVALLGLLLLGSAGAASAQQVPFETLARGVMGGAGAPANHVIRSQAELQAAGVDRLLPPGTRVDWDREMVIAALMGTKSSGGYSIEVTAVERQQMMTILPVPAPPPSYYLEVQVAQRSPAPGALVTMALTSPFHVIKLAATPERVDFVAATAAAFDAVERSVSSLPRGERVRIERGGDVLIQRTQINALIAPIHGVATAQELDDLARALRAADVTGLPARIPPPSPAPAGASQFRLLVEGGALAHETRALAGFYGQHRDRIGQINAAIDAIAQRVERQPPPGAFSTLSFSLTKQPGSRGVSLSLSADGRAVVQRTLPAALIAPVHGQATAAELDAVAAALRGARVESLPDQLPVPTYIMAGDTFSLTVSSDDPALAGRVEGDPHYLQGHEARLRPLLAALEAVVERIAPGAPRPDEAKGTVRVRGGDVLLVEQPGLSYRVTNHEYAAILRNFVGRTAKVSGVLAPHVALVPSPSNPLVVDIEVRDVLYPERRAGESVQVQPAGPGVRVHVQGVRVHAFGPAAPALRRAGGRTVTLDGWLFRDLQGRPSELFVEAVEAEARAFSILTRGGYWAGYLRRGEEVDILLVTGAYALVRAGSRAGFVATNRLEIGEVPVPLHGPAATPGLSGSVPGQ